MLTGNRGPASLGGTVYARMKSDIISCALAPGSYITEAELAARYGTSKTPVRFALTLLGAEGLVRTLPRRGIQIAPVALNDFQHTFMLRSLLEPHAALLAATNRTSRDLSVLRRLLNRARSEGHAELRGEQIRAHSLFHIEVARASGVPQLALLVQALHETMERLLNFTPAVGRLLKFGELDLELLSAIERQDAKAAEAATRRGIAVSAELTTRAILGTANGPAAAADDVEATELSVERVGIP